MTPLADSLRAILSEVGPLAPMGLGKQLRRRGPAAVPVDAIERELHGNRDLFRSLGDGRWDLAERVDVEPASEPRSAAEPVDPMILGGVSTDVVVVDIETTGTDAERDEIIQVAAVRFVGGEPVAALNRHVAPVAMSVPELLRVRMGWDPARPSQQVSLADALDALTRFVADDPLLAWNAAFEQAFLAKATSAPTTLIDGLAVAVLARPRGPHRLDYLVGLLELDPHGFLSTGPVDGPRPATARAHDALYDCVAAGLVHAAMVEVLRQGVGPEVAGLLPELDLVDGAPPTPRPHWRSAGAASTPQSDAEETLTAIVTAMGRENRPQQAEAARIVGAALDGFSAVVEAPTGTGKTLAYLAAAVSRASRGGRVALVTAYKNLQDQLLEEFAAAAGAAGLTTTLAVLKGADNYLCAQRLARLTDDVAEGAVEHRFLAAVFHRLLSTEQYPTRDDVSFWLTSRFPASLAMLDAVAVGCGHAGCARQQAIEAANNAQLVVMNQVLWLAPPDGLEFISTVVIDEAHDLENMATLAMTEEAGSAQMFQIVNRLAPAGRAGLLSAARHAGADIGAATHLVRRLKSATRQAHLPFARFASAISPDVNETDGGTTRLRRNPVTLHPGAWTRAADAVRDLVDTLSRLTTELSTLGNSVNDRLLTEDLFDLALRTRELVDMLWRLTRVEDASAVYYLEVGSDVDGSWRFARSPIDVAPLLQPVWEGSAGFVLISATLQNASSDFRFIVDRLGLRGFLPGGVHVVQSDFPFAKNVVFGIARWFDSIPVPRFMEEFEAECADELASLAEIGDGRLLGLFTSRARVGKAYEAIAERLAMSGIPVLAQGTGARQALVDDFRARIESVLLGTRSFWQGVDVPGEALSFVAIEKLPFPHMRDPITEARLESIRRGAGNEFDAYLLPAMTIVFKQGFGRLLRGPTDRGAVIVLDRRFHTKGYREAVLNSLPGFVERDQEAELSRRSFYERLSRVLPGLISEHGVARIDAMPTTHLPSSALPDVPTVGRRDERRPVVMEALQRLFGFANFRTPEQEELFWAMHDGDEVIGLLPTGAGKSLPFQISALIAPGTTLVVSPLIALMRDQVEQLLDKGIRAVGALVGQMSADERDEVLRRVENGAIRLLYVSPERLRDPVFRDRLSQLPLRRVVVDEAHCVSLWGPSFRPDFLAVRAALDDAGHASVPVAALTATATPDIEADIRSSLRLLQAKRIATPFGRRELRLAVVGNDRRFPAERISNAKDRVRMLIRILTAAERRGEAAIVYVPTVASAEQLTTQLQQSGIVARAYHGRLDSWARQNVEELFRDGEVDVVVATKAFGMGIDRADVRYVIHVGFPADLESYYQEAGRAGRDRQPSWCLLIPLAERDRRTQSWFIEQVRSLDGPIEDVHAEMVALGPGRHLVDLTRLAESTGLDETQARIVLHYLQAAGVLQRGTDQTVEASVLFLRPPENALVRRILAIEAIQPMVSTTVDLGEVAGATQEDIASIEAALLAAARSGDIVYRPFRRQAVIDVKPDVIVNSPDTSVVSTRMFAKLEAMIEYAVDRRTCRQVTICEYLGEKTPRPCGVCDVCDPEFPRPWLDVPLDEIPVPDRLLDPEVVCLYAIRWNESEVSAGRAPYGRSALELLLAGDSFNLGRYVQGAERARRVRRAQASPYWAALQLLTNPLPRIKATIDDLLAEGALITAQYEIRIGSEVGPTIYSYLVLADAGRARLNKGLQVL